MTVKAELRRRVMRHLFSLKRRDSRRISAERKRQSSGNPHVVEYFHEAGDLVREFLQGTERAEPATENTPPPEQP